MILQAEMRKGAFLQLQGSEGLMQALQVMVDASSFDAKDARMLTALVQTDDDEVEIRQSTSRSMRPPPRAYKNRSRGIVDTLRTILETAQTNLAALRKTETTAVQEYERMKSTLQHSIETDTKAVSTYKESTPSRTVWFSKRPRRKQPRRQNFRTIWREPQSCRNALPMSLRRTRRSWKAGNRSWKRSGKPYAYL